MNGDSRVEQEVRDGEGEEGKGVGWGVSCVSGFGGLNECGRGVEGSELCLVGAETVMVR